MNTLEQVVPEGYKQSDVGIIPVDWDIFTLGELSELTSSKRIFESDYVNDGVPFYRGQEISSLLENKEIGNVIYISKRKYSELKARYGAPKPGEILITAVGTLGNALLIKSEEPFYFKDGNLIWARKIKNCSPQYLINQLNYNKKRVLDCAIGSSQKALTMVSLSPLAFAIPESSKEQISIANALSDVDALLAELEKLIAKKQAIKTGTMQQLLTGKTRLPQFATYTEGKKKGQPKGTKSSELGEIPEDWDVLLMDEVTYSLSSGATPFRGNPSFYKGNNRWITSGELKYGVINDTIEKISDEAIKRANLKVHQPGTFLMAITGLEAAGTRGSCGIVGMPATTNQSCMAIYPNKKLKSSYLFHWYVYNGEELALKYCQGTKQLSYTAGLLKTIPVLVPRNTDEQTIIATILSDMDNEIQTLEQRLTKTRQIKQGMMQELLTGRTRLPFKKES